MKWFRLYSELRHDPKVQLLDPLAFKCWINLLTLANDGTPRGRIKPALIPYELRMDAKRAEKMVAYFLEQELLERDGEFLVPHGWDSRQFASDNVTERSRQHRSNAARNSNATLQATNSERPQKQSTDTDSEAENPPNPPPGGMGVLAHDDNSAFATFWDLVMRKEPSRAKAREAWDRARQKAPAADIVAGLERWLPVWEQFEDATKIPHATTWLNQERWTVEHPTAPGEEPLRREREPAPAPLPPTPEQVEQRRQRDHERAVADQEAQRARERDAVEQAARDPTRPPTISPERWASLLPDVRRRYAMQQ